VKGSCSSASITKAFWAFAMYSSAREVTVISLTDRT
jgi:hypothetical protein